MTDSHADDSNDDSSDASPSDLDARLQKLSPLMNLLDQARDAIASPLAMGDSPKLSHLDLEPPDQLGDFELMSPIGRGGMGVVYEARQRSLDRIVALKVLPKSVLPATAIESDVEPTSQQNLVKRFHVEARAAASLHHTNIVPVYGFGEDAGFYFFVMQRIYGLSLDRWIENQFAADNEHRLNQQQLAIAAAQFGSQAASALAYAHGEGILHRDVKPANLLIDEDDNLQIADFGIARIDDSEALTQTSDVVGTLRYMAPEQVSGESTPQSDVYSLGVTLYEMVTGVPALDDASVRNALLLQKRPSGPKTLAKIKPGLPLDLRTIVEKAMMPDATDRYESAAALGTDLDRFLAGRPIIARRMPWWERSSRWIRANQMVSLLTSMLILALTMAAGISIVGRTQVSEALDQETIAKRSAENTAELATKAMEQVFGRFSSSADASNVSFEATDFSAPAVDPKTAALLEELLGYYDALAAETTRVTAADANLSPGVARMHVGAIYQQLGKYDSAIIAYQDALREAQQLDPVLAARIQNQIGMTYQHMGENDRSKAFHQEAIDILNADGVAKTDPAVQFETGRSRLLARRQLRPGMGPQEFPPAESFEFDPWSGSFPSDRFLSGRPPVNASRMRPARPGQRATIPNPQQDEFGQAVEQLVQLREETPNSIPVKLLLATMVREALGDSLVSRRNPDANRRLLELSATMERELSDVIQAESASGNDAAARYELVRLLMDFNVFRKLTTDEIDVALEMTTRALPHIEYLTDYFANVPAYENLAIHTWYKAAMLHSQSLGAGPMEDERAIRLIRTFLRQAFLHELHQLERNPDADGYALWCSLFMMRIADLQLHAGEDLQAIRSYRRALRLAPLSAPLSDGGRNAQADWEELRSAMPVLLERFAYALEFYSPETAAESSSIADHFRDNDDPDWNAANIAVESLLQSVQL